MKVVLLAVIAMAAAGSTLAQAPARDTKAKLTPVKFIGSGEMPARLRATKLGAMPEAKAKPYIYKAPLATRPIKTW